MSDLVLRLRSEAIEWVRALQREAHSSSKRPGIDIDSTADCLIARIEALEARSEMSDEEIMRVIEKHAGAIEWSDDDVRNAMKFARALLAAQPQAEAGHEMCGGCMGTGTCTYCNGRGTIDASPQAEAQAKEEV